LGANDSDRELETFLQLTLHILHTLQFMHAKGFVHGDIKPHNIIIRQNNEITLTDFGMVEEISLSHSGPVQGTLNYMSPEVIRGTGIDQRSDIYSLGVMAYEILGSILPFSAADPVVILRQHLTHVPQPLKELNPDCPQFLSSIVMKCLEKRPLDRFQSADEIIKEIARNKPELVSDETFSLRESYILTSEFVGRKKELDYLVRNLELSLGGNGQTVFIGGEVGSGKSRLLSEFKIHCQLEGCTVLLARCYEKESRLHQTIVSLCQQLLMVVGHKHPELIKKYSSRSR